MRLGPPVAFCALRATTAHADDKPAPPAPAPQGIDHAPRRPGDLVTLSVQNADLEEMVRAMNEITGKRFIVAAAPKAFQATIIAPDKVTVEEAYEAFLSVLAANHLTVVPRGRFYKIIEGDDAVRQAPVRSTRDPIPAEERFVTYVHRVAHVSAEDVASAVLSKVASKDGSVIPYGNVLLITDTSANVQRMIRILDEVDLAQAEDKLWLEPLQYAAAAEVKKELDELVDAHPADRPGDKAPKASTGAGGDGRITRIVALDRPNALLVVGTQGGYERLLEIVRAIDVAAPGEGRMHVVMLEHADAKKLSGPLNEAVAAASQGGAAPGTTGGKPGLGVLESQVKISAEETNNALIVTASAHDFAAVREVIRELDRPRRQVYIEAVVMDLDVQRSTQIDAGFHGFGDLSGALGAGSMLYGGSTPLKSLALPTDATTLQGLVLGVRGPSIPVPSFLEPLLGTSSIPGLGFFLDAFSVASDSDILQTPHVLATDNVPATIYVQLNTSLQKNAASYGVPSLGSSSTGQATSALSSLSLLSAPAATNYGKIGPKIKITPHLNESDDVRLDIEETISDLTADPPQGTLGTVNFVERGATTTLSVHDEHTVVIGGLVRDKMTHSATKVPLLGDIPILGALFRSTQDAVEKANLVLVLTPHIVRDEDDMRRIFEKRMQERQEFLDHYFVFRDEQPVGFNPAHGHGMLAELRASYRDVEARRSVEPTAPAPGLTAHTPHAPLGLPSARSEAAPEASPPASAPPALVVAPMARTIEHLER
jgi:general secretion pathway protein D